MGMDFEQILERFVRMETKLDGLISSFNCINKAHEQVDETIKNLTSRLIKVEIELSVVRWIGSVVVLYLLIPFIKKVFGL